MYISATCSRLNQYLKGQQILAPTATATACHTTDTSLKISAGVENGISQDISDCHLMNLFQQDARFGTAVSEEEKARLIILDGGQMFVSDNFPEAKANDLIMMAGKDNSSDHLTAVLTVSALSRRTSLHRFMERRRERIKSSKILYSEQMFVSNDFSADKVNDLIMMADKGSPSDHLISVPAVSAVSRKASLHRFMERRRKRIKSSKIPNQFNEPQSAASVESGNWLF